MLSQLAHRRPQKLITVQGGHGVYGITVPDVSTLWRDLAV